MKINPALIVLALLVHGCGDPGTAPDPSAALTQEPAGQPQAANLFTLGREAHRPSSDRHSSRPVDQLSQFVMC